ncbi:MULTISPECIES: hypothetical protein [Nostoc]|uniref:Uncharacterized protein n=1 Tax=Nostoc paludosum FACHB-159 TaxID=2692908 RepID=A0ABR8K835_9NOSO|nr:MULTISPECIES: hypothetical protein [Nostoc]MBD2678049.1 hypothetical protein [Nostoc sp. FACHB-857]MBD2734307.1 hypothetical protein [Nostoc paludosum FACHB-159]
MGDREELLLGLRQELSEILISPCPVRRASCYPAGSPKEYKSLNPLLALGFSVVACGKPLTLLLVRPLRERRYRFANASTIFRYLCVSPDYEGGIAKDVLVIIRFLILKILHNY